MRNLLVVLALLTLCITASGCGLLHTHHKEPQEIKVVIEQEPIVIQQVPAETPDDKQDDKGDTASTEEGDISTINPNDEDGKPGVVLRGSRGGLHRRAPRYDKKSRLEKLRELRGKQ